MQRGGESHGASVRGVANIGAAERGVRNPADGQDAAARGELVGEEAPVGDLTPGRGAVRGLGAGMRRDDVPEENVLVDAEVGEYAMDDRRGRLGRSAAGEEPLGRERDS